MRWWNNASIIFMKTLYVQVLFQQRNNGCIAVPLITILKMKKGYLNLYCWPKLVKDE